MRGVTPAQARDRKRLPARVVLSFQPNRTLEVPEPALGAWMHLAQQAGATTGRIRTFTLEGALVIIKLGGKR